MSARFALDSGMLAAPRLTIMTMTLAVLAGPAAARAQDASPWDKQPHAQAQLIAGSVMKSADATYLHAGVEIRLDTGWKTYWREPGDSGVPPTFDFAGSDNVKSVTVLWPAPERFPDGAGGNSIGYVGRIVLPLRIVQKDAAKHSSLHLKLSFAVCAICACRPKRRSNSRCPATAPKRRCWKRKSCACRAASRPAPAKVSR